MQGLVTEELKRASLQKVTNSTTFGRSGQLRRLLVWLGEKAIAGVTPAEYDVGIGPLQRPRNFDPQTDSLVRKEMSRLRAKLRVYYSEEGRADPVRIWSADAYHITFQWALPEADGPPSGSFCVMILPLRASGVAAAFLDAFYDNLLLCLSETGDLRIVAQTTARFYAGRSGDIRTFAAETGADFVVEGTVRVKDDLATVTMWAVDGRTGCSRHPCKLTAQNPEDLAARGADCLVRCFARRDANAGDERSRAETRTQNA